MRELGDVAMTVVAAAAVLGAVGCAQGAQSELVSEAVGYLVVDRSAREAGVRIDGVSATDAKLPVEFTPASRPELVTPNGRVTIDVREDEVVYVRGRDARVERGTLDVDVARDRVLVRGAQHAAQTLAEEVGGVVDERHGHFVVVAPEALSGIARAAVPDGLEEVALAVPGDADGRPALGAAFANALTPSEQAALRPTHAGEGFDVSEFVKARLHEPADEMLPMIVSCADPIAGTWVSREHYPQHHDWYRFELTITRDARDPSQVIGAIRSRSWSGGSDVLVPRVCQSDNRCAFDWTVAMHATGTFEGGEVRFDGHGLNVEGTRCGPDFRADRYNLDHFHGQLVEDGRFLNAVNNDGDRAVDEPHLFRRVSCQ